MKIRDKYNWINQPERLIFLGRNWSGNGYWNQFSKVESPTVIWCEVLDSDLHMLEETKAINMSKPFKVLNQDKYTDCPKFVNWDSLNEKWAQKNHWQSLQRLNERGGLCPSEIAANIEQRPWHKMNDDDAVAIVKSIEFKV
jgi:hypothetical protein